MYPNNCTISSFARVIQAFIGIYKKLLTVKMVYIDWVSDLQQGCSFNFQGHLYFTPQSPKVTQNLNINPTKASSVNHWEVTTW